MALEKNKVTRTPEPTNFRYLKLLVMEVQILDEKKV